MVLDLLSNAAGPFLITFRETLEAALIVTIIYAYLNKIGRSDLEKYLVFGVLASVIVSIISGVIVLQFYGGLTGVAAELFEGLAAITATMVLTHMIFWMAGNARKIKGDLEQKIHLNVTNEYLIGISILAFVAVGREGLETVLFITALAIQNTFATAIGLVSGMAVVIFLAVLMLKQIYTLNIRAFFKYTSIILVIFAAGLLGLGIHELVEVAEVYKIDLGVLAQKPYDINPPDESNILHEKGLVGSILKSLVGYDGNPEWIRIIGYLGYWFVVGRLLMKTYYPNQYSSLSSSLGFKRKVH